MWSYFGEMEGRSLKFLCGDLSFLCLLHFMSVPYELYYFLVEGKIMLLTYTCAHRLCRPGCLSPAVGGRLQGSRCDWSRSCSSLSEASWRPGRDAWRGGWEGTQLSKFSYYQYRHVNQTKSPVPEYFCLQNPKYWIYGKKRKPWRALLALSGFSQSMALHSWSK